MSRGPFFTGMGTPSLAGNTLSLPSGNVPIAATGTMVNPIAPVTQQGLTQNAPIVGRQPTAPAQPVFNANQTEVSLPEISVGPVAPTPGSGTQQNNILPPTTSGGDSAGGGGTGSFGSGSGSGSGSGFGSGSGGDSSGGGGGGDGGPGGSGVTGATGFVDNPLNGYRQVAYHFKLYCKGDTGQGKEVIIAETGKTGFNIREVHINSIVAPNALTVNSQTTEFSMVITEPTGVAFLDALYIGAAASGVQHNWNTCPYYLDLSFTGYNEDGSIATKITQGMPNSGTLTWKLNITTIDTVLETAGAVYTLHGILMHDSALDPKFGSTQANHTVTGKTVKEVCEALTTQVNKKILQDYKEQIVKFEYVFHGGGQASGPNPQGYKITQQGQNSQFDSFRLKSLDQGSKEDPTANIVGGTQLTQFVDTVIGATIEGQSLAAYGKVGGDLSKIPTGGNFSERVHYRVYPEVTYTGGYNETYGQYIKTVKLHVKPYKTQVTVLDAQEVAKAGKQAWNAVQPRTRKKYQYIFTGMNTEVITFDLKFSLNWGGNLPRFAGWEMQNEMVEHHALYDKPGTDNFKAYNQGRADAVAGAQQSSTAASNLTQGLATATNGLGQAANAFNSFASLGSNASAAQVLTAAQQAAGAFTGSSSIGGATATAAQQTQQGNILASASEANLKAQAAQLQSQQQASGMYQNVQSGTFAEDLLGSGTGGNLPYTPVTLAQAAKGAQRANGTGFLGQRGTVGRSIYGALLDQLYFPDVLSTISLTVRGDPFWLGGTYENNFGETSNDSNSADFTQGDTCFALVFRYPYGIAEATGQPQFKPQNTFNGAYRATMIMHDFADGKFTQTIQAIRLAKVDPETVNSAVSQASSAPGSAGANGASSNGGTLTTTPTTPNQATTTTTPQSNSPSTNSANTLQTDSMNNLNNFPPSWTQPNVNNPSPTLPVQSATPNIPSFFGSIFAR